MKHVPVSCNRDCITGCPLTAVVEDGRVVRILNSRYRSEYMNGCARGFLYHKVLYHPGRLDRPLISTGSRGEGKFRETTWDEALDYTARRLERLTDEYGPDSVMLIGGSGACRGAFHNTALIPERFFGMFGGYTATVGNYSSQATDFVKPYMYGTRYVGIDIKTVLHSKMIVLWGFNAADTRFGAETEAVLARAKKNGIPIIVIDPRRTRTVHRFAAEWLPVYPGSDSAFMLAVLYVLISRGLENRTFIERYSSGFAELEKHILGRDGTPPKTPAWAESRCGLQAERIEHFALQYASARPAALLQGLSVQRTVGGEDTDRLGGVLQLVLGNVGVKGGSTGSGQWNTLEPPRFGKLPVPENPAGSEVPVYQWADAALQGRAGGWPADIRCLYSVGGNYIVQGSDVKKNIRAFQGMDFVVTHDYFMTDTARFSDVVLPVTTFLERRDILRTSMNYLFFSEQAVEPIGSVRNDWDIFTALAERLGFADRFTGGRSADQWIEALLAECAPEDIGDFVRTGVYAGEDQERVGLAEFIADPEGNPLQTPSGRIEIDVPAFEALGGSRIPVWRPMTDRGPAQNVGLPPEHGGMKKKGPMTAHRSGAELSDHGAVKLHRPPAGESTDCEYPLFLITPHERMRNNSQFSNIGEFHRKIDRRLWINPDDAGARGISDSGRVSVFSPEGEIVLEARVTEDIMPGVVSCSQGGWLVPAMGSADGTESSGPEAVNLLTSTEPTLPSRGARTHSVKVEVCAADQSPAE